MKKKILILGIIAILIAMLCLLTGCGNNNINNESEEKADKVVKVGNLNLEVEDISDFSCNLARIKKDGKWGFINTTGEIVIDCVYDNACDFSEEFASVKKDDKWGFIDTAGNIVVDCVYTKVTNFAGGLAGVKDGKWRFIDKNGNLITDFKYDFAMPLGNGLACVDAFGTELKEGGYAIIDSNGNLITNETFAAVGDSSTSLIPVKQLKDFDMTNGKYGYINKEGEIVIDYQYDTAYPFIENIAMVVKDEKVGIIDNTGNIVADITYPNSNNMMAVDISQDLNGLIKIYDGNKSIYFNKDGKQLELSEDITSYNFCNGFAIVEKNEMYGYIDTEGNIIIDYKYPHANDFSNGLARIYTDDFENFEFINTSGETIIAGKIVE